MWDQLLGPSLLEVNCLPFDFEPLNYIERF